MRPIEERIIEAAAALYNLIAEYHATNLYPPDPDYPHGYIKPDMSYSPDPSPAADYARTICHALLSTTQANGLCGCRLCRN